MTEKIPEAAWLEMRNIKIRKVVLNNITCEIPDTFDWGEDLKELTLRFFRGIAYNIIKANGKLDNRTGKCVIATQMDAERLDEAADILLSLNCKVNKRGRNGFCGLYKMFLGFWFLGFCFSKDPFEDNNTMLVEATVTFKIEEFLRDRYLRLPFPSTLEELMDDMAIYMTGGDPT